MTDKQIIFRMAMELYIANRGQSTLSACVQTALNLWKVTTVQYSNVTQELARITRSKFKTPRMPKPSRKTAAAKKSRPARTRPAFEAVGIPLTKKDNY